MLLKITKYIEKNKAKIYEEEIFHFKVECNSVNFLISLPPQRSSTFLGDKIERIEKNICLRVHLSLNLFLVFIHLLFLKKPQSLINSYSARDIPYRSYAKKSWRSRPKIAVLIQIPYKAGHYLVFVNFDLFPPHPH